MDRDIHTTQVHETDYNKGVYCQNDPEKEQEAVDKEYESDLDGNDGLGHNIEYETFVPNSSESNSD